MTLINEIIAYENGELDTQETLQFFSDLVRTGKAWELQGHYGRQAAALIDAGYITHDGTLTQKSDTAT